MVLICIFLILSDAEHFFMSVGPLCVLLEERSVQVLCPFFNWIVCLPGVELYEFFIYFGDQILVQSVIGKIFYLFLSLFLISENVHKKHISRVEKLIARSI